MKLTVSVGPAGVIASSSDALARERELGTFDQLLVSPTSTPEIIISKSLPALAIGTALGLFMISAGVFLFGIPFTGSFALLLASLVLFIASVVGIGLMISAVSMTQQQAILGTFTFMMPATLISGFASTITVGWSTPSEPISPPQATRPPSATA